MQILELAGNALDPLAERVILSAEVGKSVIAVAAESPGAGCTTATLCLGYRLATWGAKVALVDASFALPALGGQLGLSVASGWENVLHGDITLSEAVIASQADHMVLLPLASALDPMSELDVVCGVQSAVGIGVLRDHYDVILLDIGAMNTAEDGVLFISRFAANVGINGVVVARGTVGYNPAIGGLIEEQFNIADIPTLGVLENMAA